MYRNVFDVLEERGYFSQATHRDEIYELLSKPGVSFYIGFDPTADSLHVGHFVQMMVMSHMQKAGHRPIALMGGGTAMIGDPTGRTDMRQMMTVETIDHNVECFKKQMGKVVDFSEGKALIVNNADWLRNLNYIEFLREVGTHFSVNKMLTAECYKQRLEKGTLSSAVTTSGPTSSQAWSSYAVRRAIPFTALHLLSLQTAKARRWVRQLRVLYGSMLRRHLFSISISTGETLTTLTSLSA